MVVGELGFPGRINLLDSGWMVLITWAGKISRAGPGRDAPYERFAVGGRFHGMDENWFGDDNNVFFGGGSKLSFIKIYLSGFSAAPRDREIPALAAPSLPPLRSGIGNRRGARDLRHPGVGRSARLGNCKDWPERTTIHPSPITLTINSRRTDRQGATPISCPSDWLSEKNRGATANGPSE